MPVRNSDRKLKKLESWVPIKGLILRQPWAINREKFSKSPLGVISLEIIGLTICYSEVDFTNISSSNSLFSFIKLVLCRYPETHPFHIHDQILLTFTHKSPLGSKRVARYYKYCTRRVYACVLNCFSRVQLFATHCGLWPARLLYPWDSPGKNDGVYCHDLLQGIFSTQGSNPSLLYLLH